MTKVEFREKLIEKLSILEDGERDDIINEYLGHIEDKIAGGKSEAEAMADFGDLDELCDSILEAYHIKSGAGRRSPSSLEDYIQQFLNFIQKTTEKMLKLSPRDVATAIVEFVLLLILLIIIKWPINLLFDLFSRTLNFMPNLFSVFLTGILRFAVEIIFFIISLYVIYQFIVRRIFRLDSAKAEKSIHEIIQSKAGEKDKEKKQGMNYTYAGYKPKQEQYYNPENTNIQNDFSAGILVIRIIVGILFWFPLLWVSIGCAVAMAVCLVMWLMGYGIIMLGFCLCTLGLTIIISSCSKLLTDFVFGRNPKQKKDCEKECDAKGEKI